MGCSAAVDFGFGNPVNFGFSGIIVNDSDYKVEYSVVAVIGQCDVIRERFDPHP